VRHHNVQIMNVTHETREVGALELFVNRQQLRQAKVVAMDVEVAAKLDKVHRLICVCRSSAARAHPVHLLL
jgi:hypothetical protein